MPKSCLDGYLTPDCATCPDWRDGTKGTAIGCATRVPIDWCPSFKKVYEEDQKRERDSEASV